MTITDPPRAHTTTESIPLCAVQPELPELLDLLPVLAEDPAKALSSLARNHGPLIHLQVEGTPLDVLIVNEPSLIREVLIDRSDVFTKGRVLQAARVILGDGLLTSEGADHTRRRRLVAPAFHRPRLERYATTMSEITRTHLDAWPLDQPVDLHEHFVALMLDIVGRTLFGVGLDEESLEVGRALDDVLVVFSQMTPLGELLGEQVSAEQNEQAADAIRHLDALVHSLIEDRRKGELGDDLLSALVAARDDEGDGSGLTDEEIRDELMTLLLAGHETTANLLAWTSHLFGEHPEIAQSCADEVVAALGDAPATMADTATLTSLDHALQETLRLYPPAWAMTRTATAPIKLGGHVIKPGSQVVMSPWVTHRDPTLWHDADNFLPERWSEPSDDRHRFAFFPFGGGGRSCIGEHFALLEAMVVMTDVLRRFQWTPVEGHIVEHVCSVTLRPRDGVLVNLSERRR